MSDDKGDYSLDCNHAPFKKQKTCISIEFYIITQVILALSSVLAYDLLEDRCTMDVIVTKLFPQSFKMAERFENLDNTLRDWARDKGQKSLAEALNKFEKQEEER